MFCFAFLKKLRDRQIFGETSVSYLLELLDPNSISDQSDSYRKNKAMDLLTNKLLHNPLFVAKKSEVVLHFE